MQEHDVEALKEVQCAMPFDNNLYKDGSTVLVAIATYIAGTLTVRTTHGPCESSLQKWTDIWLHIWRESIVLDIGVDNF